MGCSRALGTAGQAPTSFQGMEDSRRSSRRQWDKVPLGDRGQQDGHQGPSRGGGTPGWAWGGQGTAGQVPGSLQGTRRRQQPQVQPEGFPLFPRPFVPQFPSSRTVLKAGTGSGTREGGGAGHFEHVPPSPTCLPSTHTRHFYVSIQPPVGELMAPVFMSENEFKKEQGEWGMGMGTGWRTGTHHPSADAHPPFCPLCRPRCGPRAPHTARRG